MFLRVRIFFYLIFFRLLHKDARQGRSLMWSTFSIYHRGDLCSPLVQLLQLELWGSAAAESIPLQLQVKGPEDIIRIWNLNYNKRINDSFNLSIHLPSHPNWPNFSLLCLIKLWNSGLIPAAAVALLQQLHTDALSEFSLISHSHNIAICVWGCYSRYAMMQNIRVTSR